MTTKPVALVIEDDPGQAEVFTVALQHADYDTVTVHDGQEALDYLEAHEPSLVIIDINLPNVTGDKVLAYIRSEIRLFDTRAILATANYRQAEMLRNDSDLVLIKPISYTQLKQLAERFYPNRNR